MQHRDVFILIKTFGHPLCQHTTPHCPSFERRGMSVGRPMASVFSPCRHNQDVAQRRYRPALRNRLATLDGCKLQILCRSSRILVRYGKTRILQACPHCPATLSVRCLYMLRPAVSMPPPSSRHGIVVVVGSTDVPSVPENQLLELSIAP